MNRSVAGLAALTAGVLSMALMSSGVTAASASSPGHHPRKSGRLPGGYQHLVVIYEENHSFDNLYGSWGRVGRKRVDGIARSTTEQRTQVAQDGTPFTCLLQVDVNLTSPPLTPLCSDPAHFSAASAFASGPFTIDSYIKPDDKTCPAEGAAAVNGTLKDSVGALPGGCTRDLVHRFYQEQYQLDGGNQDRYVTGSDAVGLSMGTYDTKALPIYTYLHSKGAPKYVIADHFFQAAFGGSFLNHQYLIAARAPVDTTATDRGLNSIVDGNGMPASGPLYAATAPVADKALTVKCADGAVFDYAKACGNIAVNTIQPASPPHNTGLSVPLVDDTVYPNIGDRLSAAGVSWNWYAGGWDAAAAGHPGAIFQYHHQPFNYFANYAEGAPGRSHLQDETDFDQAVTAGRLPAVSFVKPYGAENEHPGYASETDGSDHLVNLLNAITTGPQARSTLVVVTYDEFGGQWDHVAPPGQGSATHGYHDVWGPGTRVPALVLSRSLTRSGVDHTVYDTTSILATIERSYGLEPLTRRDASVNDLHHAVTTGGR